ncbi:hypothetical protein LSCM4_07917 [Leishmania orientalis]|uniref:Uncharacterized protein n=1 Tax=Leishmania orientalis TaxID=2249476 RepID=A0A836GZW7_9TRYP|nr:hypothetical protein LSCM4_07917 [Leishmania orientalis]
MASDDDPRESEALTAASDVDVEAAPAEETHTLDAQELHANDGVDASEDGAGVTVIAQVSAESPESPYASEPVEREGNDEAHGDAAEVHDGDPPAEGLDGEEKHAAGPAIEDSAGAEEEEEGKHDNAAASSGEDGVQINATVGDASDVAADNIEKRQGESKDVLSDAGVEAGPTSVAPDTVAAPSQDAGTTAEAAAPPAAELQRDQQDRTPSPEAAEESPKPSPPRDLPKQKPQEQVPQRKGQLEQRHAAVLHREGIPSTLSMSPYATFTNLDGAYDLPEEERIAIAAASLTPSTGLAVFRRGHENSHVNRMDIGSYSRYLLSTDHMSPLVFEDTFHGKRPTVGPVPRNTLKGFSRDSVNYASAADDIAARAASELRRSARAAAASASSTRRTRQLSRSPCAAAREKMSNTFTGTATSSTHLRRELDMLDEANLSELNTLRRQRRRDPRRGKSADEQHDYIYYNHRSKGFYVPHDPAPDTIMLQYNHLYSFGDGTRFAAMAPLPKMDNGSAAYGGTATAVHRRNPHAAPPRSFAETRGSAFPFTASQRQYASYNGSNAYSGTAHRRPRMAGSARGTLSSAGQADQQQHAATQKSSSSLRTAKALDLGRLHATQCPRPRTIEEVMANQPQRYLCGAEGSHGALVEEIERDIEDGKLQWEEVPPAMRKAMVSAKTAAAAAGQRGHSMPAAGLPVSSTFSASGHRPYHAGSLAMPPNALESVMGQMRAVPAIAVASGGAPGAHDSAATKIMSTAPPSPTAEAARGKSAEHMTCSAASTLLRMPVGSVAAAAALPAISRLNYTPQPTQRSNPSAFV